MMRFVKVRDVFSPERKNINDSGIDFYIPDEIGNVRILPGDNIKIPLGVKVLLPKGYDLTFVNKYNITSRTGLIVGGGLVSNGYEGELEINLINTSKFEVALRKGENIIQGVLRKCNYELPEEIDNDEFVAETI